jgi:hypothetical protein
MTASGRSLRSASWIAILAILVSALAPVVTRTLAAGSGAASPWDELCTSLGLQKIGKQSADRGSDRPLDPAGIRPAADCPYCLPSANPAALPPQPAGIPPAAEQGDSRFLFFFIGAAPVPPAARTTQPRAPPVFA